MNLEEAYNTIFVERLRAKSTTNEKGCWLIHTSLDKDGYHVASYRGKAVRAHKKMFLILNGEIPAGMVIDHMCRNRNCCNPEHLEAVTSGENSRRGLTGSKNKNKTHCPQGHPYSEKNTALDSKGHRHCKICMYNHNKARGDYKNNWERNNKDKVKSYNTKNYAKNHDKMAKQQKEYRDKHRDEINRKGREYYKKRRETAAVKRKDKRGDK